MRPERDEDGIFLTYRFDNGRLADVFDIFFGRARIGLTAPHNRWVYDYVW